MWDFYTRYWLPFGDALSEMELTGDILLPSINHVSLKNMAISKEFGTGLVYGTFCLWDALFTCRMLAYLQDACIPVGCLYTYRMAHL